MCDKERKYGKWEKKEKCVRITFVISFHSIEVMIKRVTISSFHLFKSCVIELIANLRQRIKISKLNSFNSLQILVFLDSSCNVEKVTVLSRPLFHS